MYFASRVQAGRLLAAKLAPKYRYENCAVVALSDGGVVVGAQIAMQLHCAMHMLLYEEIKLPMEPQALAGIASDGAYAYNSYYPKMEVDELVGEYHQYIEQQKMEKIGSMQHLLGRGGVVRRELLKGHIIILVSDGIRSPFGLELAAEYLKPIDYTELVVATPLASLPAVDRMHVLADDLYVLNVIDSELDTDHYYDQHDVPDHERIIQIVEEIVLNWK